MAFSGPDTHSSSLQAEILEALRVFHSNDQESLHFVAPDTSLQQTEGCAARCWLAGILQKFAALLACGCNEMLIGVVLFSEQQLLWAILYGGLHVLQVDFTGVVPERPQHMEMPRPAHFQWDDHESTHMSEAVDWLNTCAPHLSADFLEAYLA